MTYDSPNSRYQIPLIRLLEGYFTNPGFVIPDRKVQLNIDALDGYVKILVEDGDRRQYVDTDELLECDLDVSGAGGLHNAYVLAANTSYVYYAAWNSTTAERNGDLCLFAVPSGTAVNYALVSALTGGMGVYDMWSLPLVSTVTDGGRWPYGFIETPQHWILFYSTPPYLLQAGKASTYTAIDCSAAIPDIYGTVARISWKAQENNAVYNSFVVSCYDGNGYVHVAQQVVYTSVLGFSDRYNWGTFDAHMIATPATFLRYVWGIAPTTGLELQMDALKIW